jgi:hypothetical protein
VIGRHLHYHLASGDRAREGYAANVFVRGKRGTGFGSKAGHDVNHPRRHSSLLTKLGELERAERRFFGGLHHHRVSHG